MLIGYSSSTTLRQIPAFPLNIRSLEVCSHRTNSPKNDTYFATYFLFAPPPTLGQDRFKQFPTPVPEELNLFRGLPGGDGNRSNWKMHKWFTLFLYALFCSSHDLLVDLISCLYSPFFLLMDFRRPAGVSQGEANLLLCFQREWSWMLLQIKIREPV